jgi:hypothetical protein
MADFTSKQYKIYITPRVSKDVYGSEIEVSAEILDKGTKTMKKSIDSSDYEVGVYTYGDIGIKVFNINGKYNNETDGRSIFPYSRDLAKVRAVYSDNTGEYTRFKGLINEEATKQDITSEEVEFRVLSVDSVIRTTKIAGGLVTSGLLASDAIKAILNQANITRVLNYSASNISVDQDFIIDDGSFFDNKNVRKGLNELLVATNSVLIIDSSDNMIVKSRAYENISLLNLYGPFDEQMRQNIHNVRNYNTGIHRTFTSIRIGDTEVSDNGFVQDYGFRQFSKSMSYVTTVSTKTIIANRILSEFKTPRIECEVSLPTYIAKNLDLLDPVSLNYPLRVERYEDGKFLPIIGQTEIGDSEMPLPKAFGNIAISDAVAFKVIEIAENPTTFETILKLRQFGWYSDTASCFVGYARIGESTICAEGTDCDSFEVANIGGAKVGCTLIA